VEHDDGAVAGGVCGSYVHGLFDQPELRAAFLNGLRARAGLVQSTGATSLPDDDIDRLADHVEAHLDARLLERIVGLETR
jgi:adenosylcobyric acid synthase